MLADGTEIRLRLAGDASAEDTEGHAATAEVLVEACAAGDETLDTEAHALRLAFPTIAEADQFRRRLAAAGAMVTVITVGSLGQPSTTLAMPARPQADPDRVYYAAVQGPMDVHEAPGVTPTAPSVMLVGPMDVHEAPAFKSVRDELRED